MNTRKCSRCGTEKPLDGSFYKYVRATGGYLMQCIDCKREVQQQYAKTEKGKLAMAKKAARKAIVEPEKVSARVKLKTAVKAGKLTKPSACEDCGATGVRIEGHHDDYSRPYDARWLCCRCHHAAHNHLVAQKEPV